VAIWFLASAAKEADIAPSIHPVISATQLLMSLAQSSTAFLAPDGNDQRQDRMMREEGIIDGRMNESQCGKCRYRAKTRSDEKRRFLPANKPVAFLF